MKERYTIEISGIELNLLTEETEEYVLGLAKLVDARVSAMVMASKRCTKTEAALFCALDYLDDKLKTKLELDEVKEENDSLKDENATLKAQLADLRVKYIKG